VEAKLMAAVPPHRRRGAHHWLILHGRYTCTARKPRCEACVIRAHCAFANPGVTP
jgi:endonuclease-3